MISSSIPNRVGPRTYNRPRIFLIVCFLNSPKSYFHISHSINAWYMVLSWYITYLKIISPKLFSLSGNLSIAVHLFCPFLSYTDWRPSGRYKRITEVTYGLLNIDFSISPDIWLFWGLLMFNFPWTFDSHEGRYNSGIREREKALRNIVYPHRHCSFSLGWQKKWLRSEAEGEDAQV